MSDASHARQITNLDRLVRDAGNLPATDFQRWLSAKRLAETWLPSFYHPKFDVIDATLVDPAQRWVRLGDVVEQFSPPAESPRGLTTAWLVDATGTSLRISATEPQTPTAGTVLLPDRAIIIQVLANGSLAVEYWDSSLYPGGGAARQELLVLTSSSSADPGWIAWELRTNEILALQLNRARMGVPYIDRSQIFRLWIPMLALNEQAQYGNTIRGMIRENHSLTRAQAIIETSRRSQRDFLVTGATLQDRLRQFEDYLLGEQWIAPGSVFSIDRIEGTLRFTVRPIQRMSTTGRSPMPVSVETTTSDKEWIEWCDGTENPWRVFNSFLHKDDLPAGILARIIASTNLNEAPPDLNLSALPKFNVWRQVYRSVWDLQGGLNPSDWSQMLEIWLPILGGQEPSLSEQILAEDTEKPGATRETPESSLIAVIRDISRPILGLKAVHEGEVVRIFLIIGPDQADDPLHAAALLEGYASILSENLNRATHFTAEAAQKESIRRLSWLRHHLNGPLGIASNALDDIRLYLKDNPQVADELVPNTELANKMAARPGRNLSDHTLRARLNIVEREISNLKGLSDRIRQLSEIGPDEPMSPVDLAGLLRNRADRCRDLIAGLALHYDTCNQPVVIVGSERLLMGAIDELLFNACRELKEHLVPEPCLVLSVALEQHNAVIKVQDNGLPINDSLPIDPFREGVTKYRGTSGGTGLGLTIVRNIVGIHGGECLLAENRDQDDRRLAGATFSIVLPINRGLEA